MKIYIYSFMLLLYSITYSQILTGRCSPKIFYTSKDFFAAESASADTLKRVGINVFTDQVVSKNKNGNKTKIPLNKLWGIRRKNDYSLRFYKEYAYIIVDIKPIFLYLYSAGRYRAYYFSLDENSPLYGYTKKNLKSIAGEEVYNSLMLIKHFKRRID